MYLDGLEIAGLGVGMVFLALVVMFGATLGLRLTIDKLGAVRIGKSRVAAAPTVTPTIESPPVSPSAMPEEAPSAERAPRDKAARAAAIAVALYLTEEEEAEGRRGR
jgi:hypothetical protein